jgi:hypothetical protein
MCYFGFESGKRCVMVATAKVELKGNFWCSLVFASGL